jgi:hypothetical protein
MSFYTEPPAWREYQHDKPTLLVCWWITLFCTIIILLRITGRFIRTERLFREDKMAALALIPLYARMGCVHYILRNGTNNNDFTGVDLSEADIRRKEIASGLVLGAHVLYAATLWVLKNTILEFLKRLAGLTWDTSYEKALVGIRWTLVITFVAVVISDFAECQPFNHYWQVLPDPGGQCRQSFVQLTTMVVCNIVTDLMLVIFPIPLILRSNMTVKRKVQLVLLFSLSLFVVGVSAYRLPNVIREQGRQQYRSLLASVELLFATASANSLVLGSFVRDRGVKKAKFRRASAADSFDRSSGRRPTLHRHWGSDEDLVRDVGLGVDPKLRDPENDGGFVPATAASDERWHFPQRHPSTAERSDDSLLPHMAASRQETQPRKLSFFDVGGLLEDSVGSSIATQRRESSNSGIDPLSPSNSMPAGAAGMRRGSTALLQDLGGLLGPTLSKQSRRRPTATELQPMPHSAREPQTYNMHGKPDPILRDPGGLLSS